MSEPAGNTGGGPRSLLEITALRVGFDTEDGEVQAVRDISPRLERGEILALCGESGRGEPVTAMSMLGGEVPSPPGCRFHTRCPVAVGRCRTDEPPPAGVRDADRPVACHLVTNDRVPDIIGRD